MEIKELGLITNNLTDTEVFYNQVLDIPTAIRTETEISFLIGKTKISFQESPADHPVYHIAFDVPKNQLQEAYEWLKQRTNILPVNESTTFSVFELWNAKSFYFYDNNGNLLELICRYDLENTSDQPFSSSSILYASEIGLVTGDVPFLAETLMSKYGLNVYEKQPVQDNFTALGDEQGLLIIVNNDRNWFPTDKKASSFPTKIVLNTGNGKDQEILVS